MRPILLAAASILVATAGLAQSAPADQAGPASAKPARHLPPGANEPLALGEGKAVAQKLAEELEKNFVYADIGQRYAAMLRSNAASGRYDQGSRIELADRMTEDLQAIQKDGHLHVRVSEPEDNGPGGGPVRTPRNWPALIQSAKEIAPGIAMDRAEIVGLNETVKTPAGEFKNVLKVLETTPLEPGVREFKYYASGVGLIQDGDVRLVKYGK